MGFNLEKSNFLVLSQCCGPISPGRDGQIPCTVQSSDLAVE